METKISFLDAVAQACLDHFGDLSDFCFIFPNKRSGSFFLKSLSDNLGDRVMLAPEVMDIAAFMARLSGHEVASRIEALFRLYKVYCELNGSEPGLASEDALLNFDRFLPWGEVVINDLSDVDKYDVDAGALFKNVRDFRNISANFLTEEQKEIIERYFGYRPGVEDLERFWRSVYEEDPSRILKQRFLELWELLPELYEGLRTNLAADGLALQGTTFREAMEKVEESGTESLPWRHLVVVGFNRLSTTEGRLFSLLAKSKDKEGLPYADFFWDATGPVLSEDSTSKNSAATSMRINMRNFPMPQWGEPFIAMACRNEITPEITIAAAPSNAAQVKIAGDIIEQSYQADRSNILNAKTAVVVPDENLLMPLLHSLPPSLQAVNLTMGYSLKYTSVASFIYHLRRLQTRRRNVGSDTGYYFEDLCLLLAHPLVHVVVGTDKANKINSEINHLHLRVVTMDWIGARSPELAEMLMPLSLTSDVEQTVAYLDHTLMIVADALSSRQDGLRTVNSRLERSLVTVYRMALSRLLHSVKTHGISMHFLGVFHLVDRLIAGEKITFEGEPLEGLQLMGLLETRAIDFDNLIILSMNDKVMPGSAHPRTFIPDSLRHAYGLPTSQKAEELYSYYFYRLLSRARNVTLIYDARAGEGMRSGGKSRFLMQLELLYARGRVKTDKYSFMLRTSSTDAEPVEKTPAVMEKIEDFRATDERARNLSASALMNYCSCQLKFYFKNVVGINDDLPAGDYIDAATQGNIVHKAMLHLYFPPESRKRFLEADERIVLQKEDLEKMLTDKERIELLVRRAVNSEHFKLTGEDLDRPLKGGVAMVAERLVSQIEDVVRHDLTIAPVTLVGGEMAENVRWQAGDSPEINMRYAFDRVDIVDGNWRIVDYKTGSSHVKAADFQEIFSGASSSKYLLQLLLYSHLLDDRAKKRGESISDDIRMLIYDVNKISEGEVAPEIDKVSVKSHKDFGREFIEGMEGIVSDIFDASKPFMPTDDESHCLYCNFRSLCGKA